MPCKSIISRLLAPTLVGALEGVDEWSEQAVAAGETLWQLALRFYGDAELYRLIATASGIANPSVINVGQRLIMPDFTRYTVVAGDTLSVLALRFYGDADLYPLIATASGTDPSDIDGPAADHPGCHEIRGCLPPRRHAVGAGCPLYGDACFIR